MQMKFSRALVWPTLVAAALAACTQDLNITNPNAPDPHDRVPGTIAANVLAYERGARVFRVHDVAEAHQALRVASATLQRDGA